MLHDCHIHNMILITNMSWKWNYCPESAIYYESAKITACPRGLCNNITTRHYCILIWHYLHCKW